eukprot:gene8482-11465_t
MKQSSSADKSAAGGDVDESLYSRQLYVMGHEAQQRMSKSTVLIIGMNGLGVEIAKNIILAGVKSVYIYDETLTSSGDLSSQFYLTEQDIGINRAIVTVPKLAELNPYVHVSLIDSIDLQKLLPSVVVMVELPLNRQLILSDECRSLGISVISGEVYGVFGNVFCDFGTEFVVNDVNGEPVASSMITSITQDSKALVTVLEDTRHNLTTGDVVKFSEIVGMTELNGLECVVEVKDSFSFLIDIDSTQFTRYERGGFINQIKQPVSISFKSMRESIINPGEFTCDFVKIERAGVLHSAFIALHEFRNNHNGELPRSGNPDDAQELFDITLKMNASKPEDGSALKLTASELENHKNIVLRLAMCSRGLVSPMCALMGGIIGQEVLKACSGKFMPIKQWFYYDAVESLPDEPLSIDEVTPNGSRYDGQIMVYGKSIQSKLSTLKMFLVGAGAIGCEMIKNWAMMGIACDIGSQKGTVGDSGLVTITDMDQIEKSNLSRQFLFRNTDINCPKSTTAVNAVKRMNPYLNAIACEHKVATETEAIFDDRFYESLDMVCTALDNVEARLYIDQKCLFYRKPMLESGTLGAKGHTQIVVPFKTENYGATRDPPEKSIPVCTLKHFPNQIDHTLQWAREWFEEVYKQTPEDVNQYIQNPDYSSSLANQQNMRLDVLNRIKDSLTTYKPSSYADCITWSRHVFEDLFANRIKQILHNFPIDRVTSNGTLFWSGAKIPPNPIEFDSYDQLHLEFIISSASMRASSYNIPVPPLDENMLRETLNSVIVEKFKPLDGVKIAATDEEAKAEAESRAQMMHMDIDQQCNQILSSLPSRVELGPFKLQSVDFDKDVDNHMRVVAAVSNLRARNYRIPEADLHVSRGIAGKITPAIATTTALVTGIICIELYKILQNKPLNQLMNSFNNLALPLFTTMEPEPPKTTTSLIKGKEWKWTQ